VNKSVLGSLSSDFVPQIKQLFVQAADSNLYENDVQFEDVLYNARREIQVRSSSQILTLSSRSMMFLGLFSEDFLERSLHLLIF